MLTPKNWKDYELIDSGDGMKLERWGDYTLARPDPQAIWRKERPELWATAHGTYTRSSKGGGSWKFPATGGHSGGGKKVPEHWKVSYPHPKGSTSNVDAQIVRGSTLSIQKVEPPELNFWVRPTDFKHTGLFPEQAVNWDWLVDNIKNQKSKIKTDNSEINILNLFAYTGAATVACAVAGAKVTHVDASKGIVNWAKENLQETMQRGLPRSEQSESFGVRWIVDDAFKFVQREAKRGVKYDGIIMDPPSYGRGAKGEMWKIEKMLTPLVESCVDLLSDNHLFFMINSYTAGLSSTVIANVLDSALSKKFGHLMSKEIEAHELGLQTSGSKRILPAGVTARWSHKSS